MLSYVVISGESKDIVKSVGDYILDNAVGMLTFAPTATTRWQTSGGAQPIEVIVWHNGELGAVQASRDFKLSLGWAKDIRGHSFGEYLTIDIDAQGNGRIDRNKTGIYGLYSARTKLGSCDIVSDVSSLCAFLAQGTTSLEYNKDFMATALAVGWPMFDAVFFKGVTVIKPGQEPRFIGGRLREASEPSIDCWWDDDLHQQFKSDPDGFWDQRTAELVEMVSDFFQPDGAPKSSTFALSGGKDSRLLIAALLKYPKFKDVLIRTIGSPYSGDVLAATEICKHYDLRHQVVDTVFSEIDLGKALREHLFLTQGRVAPIALIRPVKHSSRGYTLNGHELGMRDPFAFPLGDTSREALQDSIFREFSGFDRAGILSSDAHSWVREKAADEFEQVYATSKRPEEAPWRFYIENRILHYVTQIKAAGELFSAVPYPLMTDRLGSAFYVIGREARLEERPHYEMMRRLEPWLVYRCPLNAQRWPVALRAKEKAHHFALPFPNHSSPQAPANGVYAAIDKNRHIYRDFVLSRLSSLSDLVDREKVEAAFARPAWSQHELGSLLYLVTFLGATGVDWASISPRIDAETPFPPVVYSTQPTGQSTIPDGPVADAYRRAVPEAVIGIARDDQARLMLNTAYDLQKAGQEAEATEMFIAAAALGHPQGHFHLARAYQRGEYVAQNHEMALRHFNVALEKGMLGAAASIGDMYLSGHGVSQNVEEAIRFYRIAAVSGDAWTPLKLARACEQAGRHEEADWPAAFKALSEGGTTTTNAYAAFVCWEMLTTGKVADSKETAADLLATAARLGNQEAAKLLESQYAESA